MAVELFDNAVSPGTSTQLDGPVANTDTHITVRAIASEALRQVGGQFRIIVINPATGDEELMLVTSGQWSNVWQVVRGIENSIPLDFPSNSIVRHILTAGALASLISQGGVINPPPSGSLTEPTVDSGQLYKIILFGSGKVLGIPSDATPPLVPGNFRIASTHLAFVSLAWDTAPRAATYTVFRNGSVLASGITGTTYSDFTVQLSQTYQYSIRAYDQYGQPSSISSELSAFINPTLDRGPSAKVTVFPNPIPQGGTAVVRVNGYSLDALGLSLVLGVDQGQLQATPDPSIWYYSI